MKIHLILFTTSVAITTLITGHATPTGDPGNASDPLLIQSQGSFAVGGTVNKTPGTYNNNQPTAAGQTFHGDHLYAFYQVPPNRKALPIVMLHGAFQSARSWETTPDGREGFQTLFLRRGYPVYLVDQPRRGRAGNSTVAATIEPTPNDQLFFDQFRIGKWPQYFDNVQFDRQPETLDQFFRSVTPNTGPFDAGVISDAMAALFAKTGPAILFTHSQGGGPGWLAAIKNANVKAIVAFEPGSGFIFPPSELPPAMPSAAGTLSPEAVPLADFEKLTRIPIVIVYGDNFPTEPTSERGQDNWRVRLAMARLWVDAINRHGGDARLIHLPEIGIRGNTHFPMSDLNNVRIAALPFEMYRQGYEYYWRTHAHPGSTFRYTTSSLLDLMRWDATDQIALIEQPLLMIAGSKADSLYMTEDAFAKATGAKDKELFKIEGATHIETYWVPRYVDAAMGKLTPFYARTL